MQGVAIVQKRAHAIAENIKTAAEGRGVIVTKAATAAQAAFNAVANMNPYVLLATGIGLAVSAFVGFISSTEEETKEMKEQREEAERLEREYRELVDVEVQMADARTKGVESCSDEIGKLELLYAVATDVNRSTKERKAAVDELQKTYPDYLGNLRDEAIMAGECAENIQLLKNAIIEKAIAQAQQDKISEFAGKYVQAGLDIKRANEMLSIEQENYQRIFAQYNDNSFTSKGRLAPANIAAFAFISNIPFTFRIYFSILQVKPFSSKIFFSFSIYAFSGGSIAA